MVGIFLVGFLVGAVGWCCLSRPGEFLVGVMTLSRRAIRPVIDADRVAGP